MYTRIFGNLCIFNCGENVLSHTSFGRVDANDHGVVLFYKSRTTSDHNTEVAARLACVAARCLIAAQ